METIFDRFKNNEEVANNFNSIIIELYLNQKYLMRKYIVKAWNIYTLKCDIPMSKRYLK